MTKAEKYLLEVVGAAVQDLVRKLDAPIELRARIYEARLAVHLEHNTEHRIPPRDVSIND